jgi:alpha-1,6-mannosyltransferase
VGHRLCTAGRGLRGGGGPLKILDITEFYSELGGGVKTYLHAKAQWLSGKSDVEHTIVVPGPHRTTEQIAHTNVHFVAGPKVPASPGYHFLTARRDVHRLVRTLQPDVIEVGSPFFASLLTRHVAREGTSRRVLFQHAEPQSVYVEHGLRKFPRILKRAATAVLDRYLRRMYRSCDKVVVATEKGAHGIRALGVDPLVIPLGADTELFSPERRDAAWRREVGAKDGQPIGLYVGRLATEKRLDVVLDALHALNRETGLLLVLIGEGHLRPILEQRAQARPRQLRVLPYISDRVALARACSSADFFVAPGPYETFGLAAIEAMASGLPVVGVDCGGIGELLRDAPWARTYRTEDSGDVVRAVTDLLATDMRELGKQARSVAVERYRLEATFERLLELYREVASKPE